MVRNHDWSSAGDDERTAPRKWASSHFEFSDGARSRARGMAARIARRLPLKYEGAGNVRCIVAPISLSSSLTELRRTSRSSGLYQTRFATTCQYGTSVAQASEVAASFDRGVGTREQRRWDFDS